MIMSVTPMAQTNLGTISQHHLLKDILKQVNSAAPSVPSMPVFNRILLKAVCKGPSKEAKLFTLRNVRPSIVTSCDSLRRSQLSDDIIKGQFNVGVMQNNSSAVTFRSAEDIA